jgi:hypothetical protein
MRFALLLAPSLAMLGCAPKPVERPVDIVIYSTASIFKSTDPSTLDPSYAKFVHYYYTNRDSCVGFFAPNYYLGSLGDPSRDPYQLGSIVLDSESKGVASDTPKSDDELRKRAIVQLSKWKPIPSDYISATATRSIDWSRLVQQSKIGLLILVSDAADTSDKVKASLNALGAEAPKVIAVGVQDSGRAAEEIGAYHCGFNQPDAKPKRIALVVLNGDGARSEGTPPPETAPPPPVLPTPSAPASAVTPTASSPEAKPPAQAPSVLARKEPMPTPPVVEPRKQSEPATVPATPTPSIRQTAPSQPSQPRAMPESPASATNTSCADALGELEVSLGKKSWEGERKPWNLMAQLMRRTDCSRQEAARRDAICEKQIRPLVEAGAEQAGPFRCTVSN